MSLAEIERRFTLAEHDVELPGLTVRLLKPRNFDDLISEADYVRDERLPYWADLWVAAEVLATYVLERADELAPARGRALELGCGLGLVSIAAKHRGFDVLATDYYDDALLFAAHNAAQATGSPMATRMVDWTAMPDDLGTFDVVLAADVLYEMRYAPVVADAVARTLAPGGVFVLSDQGRIALSAFLEEARARGLDARVTHRVDAPEGVAKPNITVYELRWKS
jgi:predicted nicotinamide N-methyase